MPSPVIDALWPGNPYPRGATWDGMGVNGRSLALVQFACAKLSQP